MFCVGRLLETCCLNGDGVGAGLEIGEGVVAAHVGDGLDGCHRLPTSVAVTFAPETVAPLVGDRAQQGCANRLTKQGIRQTQKEKSSESH